MGKVATTLGLIFKLEEMKAPHFAKLPPTDSLEAYDDLLRASQYFVRFTKEDNLRQRQWIQKAIELDPKYAEAYAWLSDDYQSAVLFRWSDNPQADLARSYELAQKALALDDSSGAALGELCGIDWQQGRFDQAVAEGERCVVTNPSRSGCYLALAIALSVSNKPEDAVRAADEAMRLDPTRPDFYAYFIAEPYVQMGRYQEAIPLLKKHIALYSGEPWAHVALVVAYIELGRDTDARAEAGELMRINPGFVYGNVNKDAAVNRRWQSDLRKAGLK